MSRGFTFLETVVAVGVLMIFFAGITAVLHMSLTNIAESRVRSVAMNLAQQRLEMARNLPFQSVGTVGGIPSGTMDQSEDIELNGQTFVINTNVVFIDDPFDGVAPADTVPTDYKRVKVSVTWDGPFAPQSPLVALSDVAPRGLETADGRGTLVVLVYNAAGDPLSNAQVHIEASSVVPPVNLDTLTDSTGRVMLPGALTCISCYKISVSKSGYTTDRTYGTDEVTNPNKPHLSVLEAQVSQASFGIDQAATVTFRAYRKSGTYYVPFQGVVVQVRGAKEIGRSASDDPIFKFDQSISTGPGGLYVLNNMEWDNYTISVPPTSSVDMAGSWPFSPFALQPGNSITFSMLTEAASTNSLLVKVLNQSQSPVASASVQLSRLSPAYIATKSTGPSGQPDWSQVFFANLNVGLYSLLVQSDGFAEATASVSVSGDDVETFIMNP